MVHCDKRGGEAIVGSWSHIFKYEQGSSASLGSVFITRVPNNDDGTFSIDEVKGLIRGSDIHEAITQMIGIENTHNMAGMY
jgi:threonine aldolase